MLGADHVVGVGVVARDLHQASGDCWRVPVCSRLAGQGPGTVAGDPGGPDATPLEEEFDDVLVLVELQYGGVFGVLVHAGPSNVDAGVEHFQRPSGDGLGLINLGTGDTAPGGVC